MNDIRVLHLSPIKFGEGGVYGGAERSAFELARFMADEVPTRLVTFADEPWRGRVGNLDVVVLGGPWYFRGQRVNPLHAGILEHIRWATVVHCHQEHTLLSPLVALACRALGRSAFVSDRGGSGSDLARHIPALRRAYHGFLHISQYSRKLAGQERDPKARVVLGGLDLEDFRPDPAIPREPVVVFVGRLLPHKGIDSLIAGLPDGLTLELIGRPYNPGYLGELRRLATGKKVLFRLDCDNQEVIRSYRRALCVVLPSVLKTNDGREYPNAELLGRTLLEGMACGAPAICTNVASMPELLIDGQTGFVVPANDPASIGEKLAWLAAHPMEAARMGAAARHHVEAEFSRGAFVRRCIDSYECLSPNHLVAPDRPEESDPEDPRIVPVPEWNSAACSRSTSRFS